MRHDQGSSEGADARLLVEETIRLGLMLTDVLSGLLEDLPEDAFPGEESGEVLLQMVAGSIAPAVEAAGQETVRAAIALMGAVGDRVLDDLRAAMELAQRRDG